eukprot:s9810_g1.t1
MAFFDVGPHGFLETMKAAAEEWPTQYNQRKVKAALRHIMFLGVIRELKTSSACSHFRRGEKRSLPHDELDGGRTHPPQNPAWNYFRWNPELKQQEVVPPAEEQAPLSHQDVMEQLERLEKYCVEGTT